MSVSRAKSWPYAERLLSRPARRVPVRLRHSKGGVTLLHKGHALTRCYDTQIGRVAADLMAQALGVSLPAVGESVNTVVSTGVLYRAITLSTMDVRIPEARILIERLLEEAGAMQENSVEEEDLL